MAHPPADLPEFPRPAEAGERRDVKKISPQGWFVKITFPRTFLGLGGGQSIKAPLLDLSGDGARFLLKTGVAKGAQLRMRIEDPKFKDVVESAAEVIWATPPHPVADTWIVGVEFVDLPRELKLKIDGWLSYYGSEQYRLSLEKPTAVMETRARYRDRETRSRRRGETRRTRRINPDELNKR